MNAYEYAVARYTPDEIKDEPVNIGVIVVAKNSMKSFGKFIGNECLTEIKRRNPNANVNALNKILEGYRGEHKIHSDDYLDRLTNQCIHSLHFKNVCVKNAPDPRQAVEELFNEYISIKPQEIAA